MESAALCAIGKPAVSTLTEALTRGDILLRLHAIEILGNIGPDAIDSVPALEKALDSR